MNFSHLGVQVSVSHRSLRLWMACPLFVYLRVLHSVYPDTLKSSGSRYCCLWFSTESVQRGFCSFFLKIYFNFLCMGVLLHLCICIMCLVGAQGSQERAPDPVERKLWTNANHWCVLGTEPESLQEQQGLLSTEPSLQALATEHFILIVSFQFWNSYILPHLFLCWDNCFIVSRESVDIFLL